jgi:NTE family protein
MEKITKLVLSGGGLKGFAHLGAIKALIELDLLNSIDTIIGTSIGALIGALYIIGWHPENLFDFLYKLNMSKLVKINGNILLPKYGLDDGIKFMDVIKKLFAYKCISESITFKQLYEMSKIKLIVTTSCLNDKLVYYLSIDTYPDLEVLKAIRMSISLPGLFTPIEFENKFFIDGFIDNFPMHKFSDQINETFGILVETEMLNEVKIEYIESYFTNLFQLLMQNIPKYILKNYGKKYIHIIINNINATDFNLSDDKKKEMYDQGYKTTIEHFSNLIIH